MSFFPELDKLDQARKRAKQRRNDWSPSVQDKLIYSLWMAGCNLEQIADKLGVDEMQMVGQVNRVLNERNGFYAKSNYADAPAASGRTTDHKLPRHRRRTPPR